MTILLTRNLDVIYFFYGFAFLTLGIIIFTQIRAIQKSRYELFNILWLLGIFAVIHAIAEFIDMFMLIKEQFLFLQITELIVLFFSYLFLFVFGYQFFNITSEKKLGFWFLVIIALFFLSLPLLVNPTSTTVWNISIRYFLGFIGSILSALAFILYRKKERVFIKNRSVKRYLYLAAFFFIIYGVMAGLFVSKANFLPASIVNATAFISLFDFPPQVIRAIAALGIAFSLWEIINIFNIEKTSELKETEKNLDKEHNIAETLQEALLVAPGQLPGLSLGYLYHSASEEARVGGDFYDVFELEHKKVGIIIGDVSGKGLQAATTTSLLKNTIKAYAYREDSPAGIIDKTNSLVVKQTNPDTFVTVFFAILSIESGEIRYCNAGHPLPIVKRKAGRTFFLTTNSAVTGVFDKEEFVENTESLKQGDDLILYTDGVIEAKNKNGNLFGDDKLLKIVDNSAYSSAVNIPQLIFSKVMKFTNNKLADDVVLLSIGVK